MTKVTVSPRTLDYSGAEEDEGDLRSGEVSGEVIPVKSQHWFG